MSACTTAGAWEYCCISDSALLCRGHDGFVIGFPSASDDQSDNAGTYTVFGTTSFIETLSKLMERQDCVNLNLNISLDHSDVAVKV